TDLDAVRLELADDVEEVVAADLGTGGDDDPVDVLRGQDGPQLGVYLGAGVEPGSSVPVCARALRGDHPDQLGPCRVREGQLLAKLPSHLPVAHPERALRR